MIIFVFAVKLDLAFSSQTLP